MIGRAPGAPGVDGVAAAEDRVFGDDPVVRLRGVDDVGQQARRRCARPGGPAASRPSTEAAASTAAGCVGGDGVGKRVDQRGDQGGVRIGNLGCVDRGGAELAQLRHGLGGQCRLRRR